VRQQHNNVFCLYKNIKSILYQGDDNIVACTGDGQVVMGTTSGHDGVNLLPEAIGVTLDTSTFTDGILYCKFRRSPLTDVEDVTYDLNTKEYYVLLAKGDIGK